MASIVLLAPWRYPTVTYRKLIAPIYAVVALSLVWAVWASGGMAALGLRWSQAPLLLPVFMPLWTMGGRRWQDFGDQVPLR
jgi:hypothetical protein